MDHHHVREGPVENLVERTGHNLENLRKVSSLGVIKLAHVVAVVFRRDEHAVRVVGKERNIGVKGIVFEHDAVAERRFFLIHAANDALARFRVMGARIVQLHLHLLGNPGVRVDLAVGMRHRHADLLALVFERHDVFVHRGNGKRVAAFSPEVHQLADVRHRQLVQRLGVLG
ncbi:MAG: hypothetical protein BWY39_01606 [Spirochaetes bacterium ADurb.Bin269]|nr:MAG: hypothetical protein BWY39_01606 [Spirochaetes bacterium ADurb.Bin269]